MMDSGCLVLENGAMQTAELDQALSNTVGHNVVVLNQWKQLLITMKENRFRKAVCTLAIRRQIVVNYRISTVKNIDKTSALTRTGRQLAG
jgi:limonene-1,2-epoxide hydrolase